MAPVLLPDLPARAWALPKGAPPEFLPVDEWSGRDARYPLSVGYATAERRPRADDVRKLWKARHGNVPNPLLLLVAYPEGEGWKAAICGPAGDDPPVESGLDVGQVERLADAALNEPSRHAAIRFLSAMWAELETELPGLRNAGMLASHELRDGVPTRADWDELCERGRPLLDHHGRDLVEQLGFTIESGPTSASLLNVGDTKRAVAVFLDEGEEFEQAADRFGATSPVSYALALADRESLAWVVATRGRQIRVYSARPDVGVGRKGRAETYIEANLALLPEDRAGYMPLLFSADALVDEGTFDDVLERSRDYAADLGSRLRDRVYEDAVPSLAMALAKRHSGDLDDDALGHVYEQALTVLFRLLFVAYAEDKDLLPYRANGVYREHALKTRARDLAERSATGTLDFDAHATDLWDEVAMLWLAVDKGNTERGVPAYNGGLFSTDGAVSPAGAALADVRLTNAEFGPTLVAMLVDEADGGPGPVDFRSLSVREFGTIYEGLLESNLSVAPSDLTLDSRKNYVPAAVEDEVVVAEGEVYFHNRSGARKSTGSYFTKPFAVEHLLDHALEPALDDHLARVSALLDEGEEAKAAEAFFDFRCVDIAMGSGHFLVAAVDRIEARLSGFLALHPIPQVVAELERLRSAAVEALGPMGEGAEIEHASLLRRQVARRCVYGVDLNPIAVELARLAIWIHTFVPGLPLSFLDHTLVRGNSLTGVGTIDEAIDALDPGAERAGTISYLSDEITSVLGRANEALTRLARATDATAGDIADARSALGEAAERTNPARYLFDLIVAARQDAADLPVSFDVSEVGDRASAPRVRDVIQQLRPLHFPTVFPEVFLRSRQGFDCVLGNPPWEKLHIDEHGWWALRFPGLRSLAPAEQQLRIHELREARPDLVSEYDADIVAAETIRNALVAGPYPGLGRGHPDLYKAFAWRFLRLAARTGRIGVVMPRSSISASGSGQWRESILDSGRPLHVVMLQNSGGWVFPDVHPQDRFVLMAMGAADDPHPTVSLAGPFESRITFGATRLTATFPTSSVRRWSDGCGLPWLPRHDSVPIFEAIRESPSLGEWQRARSRFRPVQGDLNATNQADLFSSEGVWPVYKGASFDLWKPDTGIYFARIREDVAVNALQQRRLRQHRLERSAFSELERATVMDPGTLPCLSPRIAFADITNQSNTRTMIACLVPPRVVLTHKAPYLLRTRGDTQDEAFLLGVLSSIPLDWYARRFVEKTMTFEIVNGLPIPDAPPTDPLRRRVVSIVCSLTAMDSRLVPWAEEVAATFDVAETESQREDLEAELDACISALYGLNLDQVRHIYETFHGTWNFEPRLNRVLEHLRAIGSR